MVESNTLDLKTYQMPDFIIMQDFPWNSLLKTVPITESLPDWPSLSLFRKKIFHLLYLPLIWTPPVDNGDRQIHLSWRQYNICM